MHYKARIDFFNRLIVIMERTEEQSVKKFYENVEIFVTGGSGFLGKVLVEKLLRSCGNIKTIHLLMRAKKGETVSARIKKITEDVVSRKKYKLIKC